MPSSWPKPCRSLQNGSTSAPGAATIDLAPDDLPGAAAREGPAAASPAGGGGNGGGAAQEAVSHAEQSPLESVLKPVEEAAGAVADKVRRLRDKPATAPVVSLRDVLTWPRRSRTGKHVLWCMKHGLAVKAI